MSKAGKRLQQLRQNPAGDWRVEDLELVAKASGMAIRRSGGSHVVFSHELSPLHLTVPARRPIKAIYVRRFVEMIDAILGAT